jgi:glycosyltransferase involved in cell wall biosynthesis
MVGGGAERQLAYLARELVQTGWEVHVATIQEGPNSERLTASGATVHRLRAFGNHDPRILGQLLRIIRAIQPDVVQCWLLQMEVAGGIAASLSGTPWVFSERCSSQAYRPSLKTWLRIKVAAWSSAIVSNSSIGDQYWQPRVDEGVRRYVIPNGLPLDEITATPASADAGLGLVPGKPVVLAAGRFEPQKNFDVLVRSLKLVNDTRAVQALLCGEGSLHDHLVRLVDEEGLAASVRLLGYVGNLWSLMKRSDMLVSASLFEGSPNVVLEAMACGCPLIVSDIPAHRELLDEQTAVFIDPGRPRDVADAIQTVLSNPDAAAERARRARLRVQRYSSAVVARDYAQVYGDVSARSRSLRARMS